MNGRRLDAIAATLTARASAVFARGASVLDVEQLILAGYQAMQTLGWSKIREALDLAAMAPAAMEARTLPGRPPTQDEGVEPGPSGDDPSASPVPSDSDAWRRDMETNVAYLFDQIGPLAAQVATLAAQLAAAVEQAAKHRKAETGSFNAVSAEMAALDRRLVSLEEVEARVGDSVEQHIRNLTADVGTLAARLDRHHKGAPTDCRVCSGHDSPADQRPIGYVRSNGAGEIVFRQAGQPANDAHLGPEWTAVWT